MKTLEEREQARFESTIEPKAGEPILIGSGRKQRMSGPFMAQSRIIGGDRSYTHDVWVCLSNEPEHVVVQKILPKDKTNEDIGRYSFGYTEPEMIDKDSYPIYKCSSRTLETKTGYDIGTNLIEVVNNQERV